MRYTLQFVGSEHGAVVSLARVVDMLMLIFSVIPTLALVLKYFYFAVKTNIDLQTFK